MIKSSSFDKYNGTREGEEKMDMLACELKETLIYRYMNSCIDI